MTLQNRLAKLEARHAPSMSDIETLERLAFVIDHPTEAARMIGAAGVARVTELVSIAQARREAANEQP